MIGDRVRAPRTLQFKCLNRREGRDDTSRVGWLAHTARSHAPARANDVAWRGEAPRQARI